MIRNLKSALLDFSEVNSMPRSKSDPEARIKKLHAACINLRHYSVEFRNYMNNVKFMYAQIEDACKDVRQHRRKGVSFKCPVEEFCFLIEEWWQYYSPRRLHSSRPSAWEKIKYGLNISKKPSFFNQSDIERSLSASILSKRLCELLDKIEDLRWIAARECESHLSLQDQCKSMGPNIMTINNSRRECRNNHTA